MLKRRHVLLGLAATLSGAAAYAVPSRAQAGRAAAINTLDSPGGAAIKGYDPVAYFKLGMPARGKPEHAVMHAGATWLFSSAEHKALFEQAPDKYAPAYGGYCAYGVSRGYLVKIEPEAWSIHEGRLYLNYDLSVRSRWLRDSAGFIATANKKWPALTSGT